MNAKALKRTMVVILCILAFMMNMITVGAVERYKISELDDMVISLPDGMSAITRDSQSTNRYFSIFGIDYDTTMQIFHNSDIYLQGMDSTSSVTLTVTMTKTEESEAIGNYNLLSDDELTKIRNNFLNMSEFSSCTPDQGEQFIWFIFNTTVSNGGKKINTYQANTIYDSMSINITIQRNEGNVTSADYSTFSDIVSSVAFNKAAFSGDIMSYIIIGGATVVIILIILIAIFATRLKKRKKRKKNDAILEELASKYKLNDDKRGNHDYDIDNFESDYNDKEDDNQAETDISAIAYTSVQSEIKENLYERYDDASSESYASEDEIDDIISSAREYKQALSQKTEKVEIVAGEDVAEFGERESFHDVEADVQGVGNEVQIEGSSEGVAANVFFGGDTSEEYEDENDDELVRQLAKKTKFDSGYDFFEEAPKKKMGVLSSEDIMSAEDYDVINEVEEKVTRVESEGVQKPNKALVILKKSGKAVKSFAIHFGYFCKNVSIMIKRKRAAAKRRKAEEERRQRERMRAERARQRALRQNEDGGLVRVHSRNDSRRPQGSSGRRPSSQNRRSDSSYRSSDRSIRR